MTKENGHGTGRTAAMAIGASGLILSCVVGSVATCK
jgi:hypothetical protein